MNTAIQKSKAVHRQPNAVEKVINNTVTESDEQPQYVSFTDFVKKRKIQEAKALGRRRARSIEKEMFDKELLYTVVEEENDYKIEDYPIKI